jgi:Tol biopolymer transport system component
VSRRLDNLHSLELGTFTIQERPGMESRDDSIASAAWAATADQPFVFTLGYGQMWMGSANDGPIPIGYGFSPSLSPDATWVLYYADSPNDLNAEIYAYDPAGHALLNLSQHAAHDWSPAWSPDGREFAFVSTRDGNAEIYLAPFACVQTASCGRDARRLTHSAAADLDPAWSPDGSQLAFVREDRFGSQVIVMDIATGQERAVTTGSEFASSPAWRP